MPLSDAVLLILLAAAMILWWARSKRRGLAFVLLAGAAVAALFAIRQGGWQAWPGLLAAALLAAPFLLRQRRRHRILGRTLGALGAFAALACAAALYLFPVFSLPEPDGPYAVGERRFDLTDPARTGVLDDPPGTARRIAVWAWYPAASVDGPARSYFTGEERELSRSAARNWNLPGFVLGHLHRAGTHSHPDAPLAQARETWPVVVFNHGYGGWPGQNTALMERLASRGYLVFSIGHPHDAATLSFADGTHIPTSPGRTAPGEPTPAMLAFWQADTHEEQYAAMEPSRRDFESHRIMRSFDAWRDDIRFLVDAIERRRLPVAADGLAAVADLSRLAFVGMSFGGTASVSACHRDPRCLAAVNMDGGEFDWSLWNGDVRMPMLLILSDFETYPHYGPGTGVPHSAVMDYAYERWDRTGPDPDVARVRVAGQRHLGLTDLPLSMRMPVRGMVYGWQRGEIAVDAVNDLVAAFLDLRLRGEDTGFPHRQFEAHPALRPHGADSVRKWWMQRRPAQAARWPACVGTCPGAGCRSRRFRGMATAGVDGDPRDRIRRTGGKGAACAIGGASVDGL